MRQRRMWSLPCCGLGQNHRGWMWHFKVQQWTELCGLQLRSHVPARGRAPLLDNVCKGETTLRAFPARGPNGGLGRGKPKMGKEWDPANWADPTSALECPPNGSLPRG
ncbi:unnamed protein product [Prunus armeniaca]